MKKKTQLVLILFFVFVILISIMIFSNNLMACGPRGKGLNYDISHCDNSCNLDGDCRLTCGCGPINKNEICYDEGIIYDCITVGYETKCENNECIISEVKEVSCKDIKSGQELTFGMSYCQGDMCAVTCDENGENCHSVTTKEECETIDVVAENNLEEWSQDGKPDCEWAETSTGEYCRPNKY